MSLPNALSEMERDRLIAQKNQKLGLILAVLIGVAILVAYQTRFILWHMVFAK